MKRNRKICIFAVVTVCMAMLLSISAFAADKLDQNMSGADMTLGERFSYAMQGSATGMIMVFAVLGLLAIIVALAGKLLGPKTNNDEAKSEEKKAPAPKPAPAKKDPAPSVKAPAAPVAPAAPAVSDDGAVLAAITAAISVMIENGEYKNEFVGGFRVVSFKRSSNGAWNRK